MKEIFRDEEERFAQWRLEVEEMFSSKSRNLCFPIFNLSF
jgi:hypothetical protein